MDRDLTQYFDEYERIVGQVDALFHKVSHEFSSEVRCQHGCSDCCHALFDVSLIEALYLNAKFLEADADLRQQILIECDKYDRKAQVLKKRAYKAANENTPHAEILGQMAMDRLRCPLLGARDECCMYPYRPITCRLYGIPTEIGGKSHTCGLSGFEPGKPYPAVKLERIQDMLTALSHRMLAEIGSRYDDFRTMFVPVSTALMTVYNEEYFGITDAVADSSDESKRGDLHA